MTFIRPIEDRPAAATRHSVGTRGEHLLIYAPVPVFRHDGRLFVEAQACNGLRLWAENFAPVTAMMPLEDGPPPTGWQPVEAIGPARHRIAIEPMPTAYRPLRFLRALRPARARIRALIAQADYLSFAIGGLIGDWGAVAAIEAHRAGRPYAVWTDRVESQVVRRAVRSGPLKSRLRAWLCHRPMAALERHVIRRAALGLFHGRDTFDAYAPWCARPELVHDIHIAKSDHMLDDMLRAKIAACDTGPLRLAYVGRADAMKGPMHWVEVLESLHRQGIDFRATWLGDGDEMPAMRTRIAAGGFADRVEMPGFTDDRAAVLDTLRRAHALLFCHLTPESPRCLIEALISGTPLLGYTSAFAADLVAGHGGGRLVPVGDTRALADAAAHLACDRAALGGMIAAAAQDGAPFDDVSVFRHRSEIIKTYL